MTCHKSPILLGGWFLMVFDPIQLLCFQSFRGALDRVFGCSEQLGHVAVWNGGCGEHGQRPESLQNDLPVARGWRLPA